jgi:hypothetical protein
MIDLKSLYPQCPRARLGAHLMCWFDGLGGNGHIAPGYASTDAAVISRQADLMQACGISWINIDYYPGEATTDVASRLWLAECAKRGMAFSLCMDGSSKASTAAMVTALNDLSWAFASPAYKRNAGKPQVSEFDSQSVDWTVIQSQFPSLSFLHLHKQFAWINVDANALAELKSENAAIGPDGWQAVWAGFHDFNWGNGPERFVDYQNGQTFLESFGCLSPSCADILLVTWNDYDERTGMERNFDEALNSPPKICMWPPPITGKYLWPLPLGNVLSSLVTSPVSLIVATQVSKTLNAAAIGPGIVRIEVWDDTTGVKLAEQQGGTISYPVPQTLPSGTSIILQAVGSNDAVLAKQAVTL